MKQTAVLLTAVLASCSVHRETPVADRTTVRSDGTRSDAVQPETPALAPAPPALPASPAAAPRMVRASVSDIPLAGVVFDSRSHRLAVIDQPGGPGSRFADAASAGASARALAAINAGFFNPDGSPLGLVVSSGKTSGSWNSSSLGSAVWHENSSGQSAISRRSIGASAISAMREALQAGPLLVENHRPVSGLESSKTSARTIVAWDGGTCWMIARTAPCTLAALGRSLAETDQFPATTVLNLDGGRSADLWISGRVSGGPLTERPFWNKPVRNFLVLLPR